MLVAPTVNDAAQAAFAARICSDHQSMTFRPLVEALRLPHGPQRRIFGTRYLTRDLPAEVCQRVEALAVVRDLDDLADKHEPSQGCATGGTRVQRPPA